MVRARGYFLPVFHAYIPYGLEGSIEERYLFEYLADSLYPLLRVFEGLENEAIEYGFTLSISPVLAGMMENPSLMMRFADYIEWRIECAQKLNEERSDKKELVEYYINKFKDLRYWHTERYYYRPLKAIFNLAALGSLEVVFSNGGNGILPALEGVQAAVKAEVRTAMSEYENFSEGARLRGLWLTELAYSQGNEKVLQEEGLEYFFVDESGFKKASSPVVNGVARPVLAGGRLSAFAINKKISEKISLKPMAYCYDGSYSEKKSGVLIGANGEPRLERLFGGSSENLYTGINLVARDGSDYSPGKAKVRADKQAIHYLSVLTDEIMRSGVDESVIVVGIDHEEVGENWEEVPVFVDMLLRKMRYDQDVVRASTPREYLQVERDVQVVQVGDSSICDEGVFSEFYRNERERYLPELHLAALKLESTVFDNKRLADQMARELILAEGCEWRYYSRKGRDEEYARERQQKRLARFAACEEMLGESGVDIGVLSAIEDECQVLGSIGIEIFSGR